ncbi:hypothetical protein [Frateuria sp. STR12]|uniref:hypothetical protein n=1 Tax=Frateuria hangzhouensis TaxID=2995589 RepID=UPI002260B710|nr:hypothetical protein [Frateuria sp. STR12]MCX7513544.1 hypothetical protein [Frateuria sp. STR12]
MKRMLAGLALVLGTAALSGCYYDPGYSYVRGNGYQGDAYYGEGPSVIYRPDYYGYGGYYGPGWGYAPGVSVGISGTWYRDSHHYHRGRDWSREHHRGHDRRGDGHERRSWRGGHDRGHDSRRHDRGNDRGDRHGGRDHRDRH